MRYIYLLFLFLMLSGCAATSVSGMYDNEIDFSTLSKKSAKSLAQCILPKMESYPALVGFGFEDRALTVNMRELENKVELYQQQNAYMVSLVSIQEGNNTIIDLYVSDAFLKHDTLVEEYAGFIQACSG